MQFIAGAGRRTAASLQPSRPERVGGGRRAAPASNFGPAGGGSSPLRFYNPGFYNPGGNDYASQFVTVSPLAHVSVPSPPSSVSVPSPPSSVSSPAAPEIVSFPGPPKSAFAFASPVIVSSCRDPKTCAIPARVSVPSPVAVPAVRSTMTALGEKKKSTRSVVPPPPTTVSLPPPGKKKFSPASPVNVSSKREPSRSSIPVSESLPSPPVAVPAVRSACTPDGAKK